MEFSKHGTTLVLYLLRDYHRAIWRMCAIFSVLTSRKLLVDLNWHFPLHLLLLHLSAAILITSILLLRRQSEVFNTYPKARSEYLPLVLLAVATALSLLFSMQALLHYRNLPTLPMLTLVPLTVKELIPLVRDTNHCSRVAVFRILFPTLACAVIFLGEHRLSITGLLTAIPAVLFAGAAQALRHVVHERLSHTIDTMRLNLLVCFVAMAMIAAVYLKEPVWHPAFFLLETRHWPLLLANVTSAAAAILLGQSILFPMNEVADGIRTWPDSIPIDRELSATTTPSLLVGVIGLVSTISLRRSYTSHFQIFTFCFALISMSWQPAKWGLNWNHGHSRPVRFEETKMSSASPAHLHNYGRTETMSARSMSRIALQRSLATFILFPIVWVLFPIFNFSEKIYHGPTIPPAQLDRGYTPRSSIDIIISMYKEPIHEVAQHIATLKAMRNLHDASVYIYVKDSNADPNEIQRRTGASKVTQLPNIGREGETYLRHILEHWDTLARHTVFLQATVHNPQEFYPRINTYFHPRYTGMLSLGSPGYVCNCDDCGDHFGWRDSTRLFPQMHSRIYNGTACENVLLSYKNQFVVSAKRIRGVHREIYRDLHNALADPNSWAHRGEILPGHADSMNSPSIRFAIERIWNLLFQCNDLEVAWKCASLLSGEREGRDIRDCQCIDLD